MLLIHEYYSTLSTQTQRALQTFLLLNLAFEFNRKFLDLTHISGLPDLRLRYQATRPTSYYFNNLFKRNRYAIIDPIHSRSFATILFVCRSELSHLYRMLILFVYSITGTLENDKPLEQTAWCSKYLVRCLMPSSRTLTSRCLLSFEESRKGFTSHSKSS